MLLNAWRQAITAEDSQGFQPTVSVVPAHPLPLGHAVLAIYFRGATGALTCG